MRHLISRPAGLCHHLLQWLLALLAFVMLPAMPTSGAELPEGEPNYEFTLDGVIYKCYYVNRPVTTPGGQYNNYGYDVYALPADYNLKVVSVRLNIDGLKECSNLLGRTIRKTEFVNSEWHNYVVLKSLELITPEYEIRYPFKDSYKIDLNFLSSIPGLRNLIITGEASRIECLNDVGDVATYSDKNFDNDKKPFYLRDLVHNLVDFEAGLSLNLKHCDEVGLSVSVECDSSNTGEYTAVVFDSAGKPKHYPYVGRYQFRACISELKGLNDRIGLGSIQCGDKVVSECIEILKRPFYTLIKPMYSHMAKYGFDEFSIHKSTLECVEMIDDGYYFIPYDRDWWQDPIKYSMYLKGTNLVRRYDYTIYSNVEDNDLNNKIAVAKQTPHSRTFSLIEPFEDFGDGAIYGMGEWNDNAGQIFSFVPFENNSALLNMECTDQFYMMTDGGKWYWETGMNCYPMMKIYNKCIRIGRNIGDDFMKGEHSARLDIYGNYAIIGLNNLVDESNKIIPASDIIVSMGDVQYPVSANHLVVVEDLLPMNNNVIRVSYMVGDKKYFGELWLNPNGSDLKMKIIPSTHSLAISFEEGKYDYAYGEVDFGRNLSINGGIGDEIIEKIDSLNYRIIGLTPGHSYEISCTPTYVRRSDGKKVKFNSLGNRVTTVAPTWDEGSAEALTTTKARLRYGTNMDDVKDAYVEWRRVDAPAVVKSNTAVCPVVNGELVGILNNLNPDVYYQFRPVYEYEDSYSYKRTVYGEWVGVFTGDANVWFDPEVTTGAALVAEDGSVTLRGAVVPGSGDVSEQGFELWPVAEGETVHADAGHRFLACEGISMSVGMNDLAAGTTYAFRSYAKVGGKVYVGTEMTFTTPGSFGGVDVVEVSGDAPVVVGYYNLQGVRSEKPFDGLNIVLYSNGKAEKRMMRRND